MRKELCPTSQRDFESSKFRDFGEGDGVVLASLTSDKNILDFLTSGNVFFTCEKIRIFVD